MAGASVGFHWKRRLKLFQNFLAAMNVTDDDRKKVVLLHYSGGEVLTFFKLELLHQGQDPSYSQC